METDTAVSVSVDLQKDVYKRQERREGAMRDHEIIELYWARNESAIAATAEKYGSYCHTIAYNIPVSYTHLCSRNASRQLPSVPRN